MANDETKLLNWPQLPERKRQNGNPPGGGGMDDRLRDLERDMTDMKVAVGKIETRLQGIEQNMLTKGQMAIYALLAGIGVFGAGWWIVQQYLSPILTGISK